jgi:hypothetical protein
VGEVVVPFFPILLPTPHFHRNPRREATSVATTLLPQVEPVETFRLTRVEESHEGVIRARHSRSPLLPPLR